MNILVLNSGSSTLKYQLINMDDESVIVKGNIERIGETEVKTHLDAVHIAFKQIGEHKIDAIGHRVVHGGEAFKQATIATDETLAKVDEVSHLAPLHNPANLMGVRACRKLFPEIPNIMVFDTAFHMTIQPEAYLYAINYDDYKKHGIRRYGFHGPSHNYVSKKCAELYGKPREELRIITCHIGNGCSVCAVENGKSVETSMGLTPLEGLVMGTRSGDVDPAALLYIGKAHGFTIEQTINYLNKDAGVRALAGIGSFDFRDLVVQSYNPQVRIALDVYYHRLAKYIGAYIAVMGGVDAIVWTGGVGTNKPELRRNVLSHFGYVGVEIDKEKNNHFENNGGTGEISADGARVRTFVINTNEELEIAEEAVKLLGGK